MIEVKVIDRLGMDISIGLNNFIRYFTIDAAKELRDKLTIAIDEFESTSPPTPSPQQ